MARDLPAQPHVPSVLVLERLRTFGPQPASVAEQPASAAATPEMPEPGPCVMGCSGSLETRLAGAAV